MEGERERERVRERERESEREREIVRIFYHFGHKALSCHLQWGL
jgi:hypothetical protein